MGGINPENLRPTTGRFLAKLTETDGDTMGSVELETSFWVEVYKVGTPFPGTEIEFSEGDTVKVARFNGRRLEFGDLILMPCLISDVELVHEADQ